MNKKAITESGKGIKDVTHELQHTPLDISVPVNSLEELKKILSGKINQLIEDDRSRLISALYRLDISEEKLTQLLQHRRNELAADIIADMIIARQSAKIIARNMFSSKNTSCDEEKR